MAARALYVWASALCMTGCTAQVMPRQAPVRQRDHGTATPAATRAAASPSLQITAAGHSQASVPSAVAALESAPARVELPEVDALVAAALAAHKLPGCVVTIGRSAGVVFQRAYGQRAIVPLPAAMTEDTIFDLASLTKPIATASAIMLLVERGALELDARASRYLPELDRAATRSITVRQLLIHSAGLAAENPLRDYMQDHQAAIAALFAVKPSTAPGQKFAYSDTGYLWLGELVARVAGKPLDALTRDALFAPLAMRDTGFSPPPELLPRIAPTEVTDDRGAPQQLIDGVVHDPRAFRLGGVAGNAGLFSSAHDLSRFARMLLGGGALDGTRVLSEQSVATMTAPLRIGDSVRTLGWDMHSKYSRLRGTLLSERAYGHGGYTGVSLWIDPGLDLFVLLLSNRVHPDASGNVIGLAGALADAAVRGVASSAAASITPCSQRAEHVWPGIDVLRQQDFAPLVGKRIGLLTHLAARSADGEPTLQLLAHAKGVTLGAIFSLEHGLQGAREGAVADTHDGVSGASVYSLFGKTRRPTPEMLTGLDEIVVDLVDVGTRFYTYMSTLHEMLLAAAQQHLPVIVLDRPNPIGGVRVEGPMLDADQHSFVNHQRLPIRHGMTAGELAQLMNSEDHIGAALSVIPVHGWRREMLFSETGLRWYSPSPNLLDADAALLYPATGLLESTNLAVGRGTDAPFSHFGAPWLDAAYIVAALGRARLPGVRVSAIDFTPTAAPYAGQLCHGVHLALEDRRTFLPVHTGLEIARALIARHPAQWEADKLIKLLGHAASLRALQNGAEASSIELAWRPELEDFIGRREKFLLYARCDSR